MFFFFLLCAAPVLHLASHSLNTQASRILRVEQTLLPDLCALGCTETLAVHLESTLGSNN